MYYSTCTYTDTQYIYCLYSCLDWKPSSLRLFTSISTKPVSMMLTHFLEHINLQKLSDASHQGPLNCLSKKSSSYSLAALLLVFAVIVLGV